MTAEYRQALLKLKFKSMLHWQKKENALYCKLVFKDFKSCFDAMVKIAAIAEEEQHHPTWTNTYNVLEIWLNTHDAGNIVTEKDTHLASRISAYFLSVDSIA